MLFGYLQQQARPTTTTDHRRRLLFKLIIGQQSRLSVTHERFAQQPTTIDTTDHRRHRLFNLFPIWNRTRRLLKEDLRNNQQQ
jgi:hypothetical protein